MKVDEVEFSQTLNSNSVTFCCKVVVAIGIYEIFRNEIFISLNSKQLRMTIVNIAFA